MPVVGDEGEVELCCFRITCVPIGLLPFSLVELREIGVSLKAAFYFRQQEFICLRKSLPIEFGAADNKGNLFSSLNGDLECLIEA